MANPFIYVEGDRNKTPVNLSAQRPGTALVLVTGDGRDIHFFAGLSKTVQMSDLITQFSRRHASAMSGSREEG